MGTPLPPEVQNVNPTPVPQPYIPAPVQQSAQFFTQEDIERARREERDKLYGRISKTDEKFKTLEEEVASLRTDREARAAQEEQRRQEAANALRAKDEAELTAKQLIEQREREWNEKFQKIENEQAAQAAMVQKEREYLQLQNYITRRASEEKDVTIGAELIDFIRGDTPEEVEASIATLQEKTKRIIEGMSTGQTQARAALPGVSPTGQPPLGGPLDNLSGQQREMSAEDIAKIPMSEWHNFRQKLGIDSANTNRGLYG